MISFSAAQVLNHLLARQPAEAQRLAAHAGACFEFRSPPLPPARLAIRPDGQVSAAPDTSEAQAVISVSPLALPLFLSDRAAGMRYVQVAGDEALAQVLRDVLAVLEWDYEEDLSRVIGDVGARRAVHAGEGFMAWQRDAAERLARNFTEYWTEERPLLAKRDDVEALGRDLQALRDAIEHAEARLAIVELALKPNR
jgi:ubiquinone biosynthesis protein UbiJ